MKNSIFIFYLIFFSSPVVPYIVKPQPLCKETAGHASTGLQESATGYYINFKFKHINTFVSSAASHSSMRYTCMPNIKLLWSMLQKLVDID